MCKTCKHPTGSTKHLLYWWRQWLKRLVVTSYHLVNRRAYRRWYSKKYKIPLEPVLSAMDKSHYFEVHRDVPLEDAIRDYLNDQN